MKNITRFSRIFVGLIVTASAYIVFLNPHNISVGGMTGLSIIINRYFHVPTTIALLSLNAALFAYGWKVKGAAFTIRSVVAMVCLGLLLDIPFPKFEPQLGEVGSMLVGSALSGAGYGLVVSAQTSTGGSDQLGMLVTSFSPELSVGAVMTAFDFIVISIDSLLSGNWLFSAIAVLLCNGMIDIVDYSLNRKGWPEWIVTVKRKYKRMSPKTHVFIRIGFLMMVIIIIIKNILIHV